MTVKELIDKLKEMPEDADVKVFNWDYDAYYEGWFPVETISLEKHSVHLGFN